MQTSRSVAILTTALLAIATAPAAAYDCTNAQGDIERLQREKETTAERVLKGATAILPIGIIVHVLKGNERQTLNEVGTDDYNQHLDSRIDAIKQACGLD